MKTPRDLNRPYSIEIPRDAWAQISRLPQEAYQAMQQRLKSLAALATRGALGEREEPPSFQLGALTIHYGVDSRRRVIQLLQISTGEQGGAQSNTA